MPRTALLTGSVGGVFGAIAGSIGVIWSIVDLVYVMELARAMKDSLLTIVDIFRYSPTLMFFYGSSFAPINGLFFEFSLILAILLIAGGIFTGVGFYGVRKAGAGTMGSVGLVSGIIGGTAGGLFLILGNLIPASLNLAYFVTISVPNYLLIFIGFAILGVSLILMGVSSIVVRYVTEHSSAAVVAGVLSIVGGCLLPFYIATSLISIGGDLMVLTGFAFIISAFTIWAIVFYRSRNI
ncbi:MAG: hypothetical protein WED07_16185 [Candidatus Freyarchaeum deiterrae]